MTKGKVFIVILIGILIVLSMPSSAFANVEIEEGQKIYERDERYDDTYHVLNYWNCLWTPDMAGDPLILQIEKEGCDSGLAEHLNVLRLHVTMRMCSEKQ